SSLNVLLEAALSRPPSPLPAPLWVQFSPPLPVRRRCLIQQKRRRQRAARKIGIFIGSFVVCFAPYVMTRLAELMPFVTVNTHWGVLSKCLAYSKAVAAPFVSSLLRQPFRQALAHLARRLPRRHPRLASHHSSSMDAENDFRLQQTL
ncbi:G-protein coupled receptor 78-like, partial [Carlito syrichta]|uniref:G-protein coupled receptor 78-like n=1 Tax=Carlito syrichta TaxID=1868482 RepID=A0A3Q0E8P0_CARSF